MPTFEDGCVNAHNVKIGNFLQKNLEFITENTIFASDKIFHLQLQTTLSNIGVDGSVLRHPHFVYSHGIAYKAVAMKSPKVL